MGDTRTRTQNNTHCRDKFKSVKASGPAVTSATDSREQDTHWSWSRCLRPSWMSAWLDT